MATLLIEYPVTDIDAWLAGFRSSADDRAHIGVRAERIRQCVDGARTILVDLDFEDLDAAVAFKRVLEEVTWPARDPLPGVEGTPTARLLDDVDTSP